MHNEDGWHHDFIVPGKKRKQLFARDFLVHKEREKHDETSIKGL